MKQTENYNLNLIENTDSILESLNAINKNMEKIDENLGNSSGAINTSTQIPQLQLRIPSAFETNAPVSDDIFLADLNAIKEYHKQNKTIFVLKNEYDTGEWIETIYNTVIMIWHNEDYTVFGFRDTQYDYSYENSEWYVYTL